MLKIGKLERTIIIFLLTFILSYQELFAQVSINTAIVSFRAEQRPVQNLLVGNSADFPLYVSATVEEVLDPAAGGAKSVPSEDLLVSPRNFSVGPKSQRTVRLLLRKSPKESEVVYRVTFSPQDRGFGGKEIRKEIDGRVAMIRVLSGMGVLAFAEPANPKTALSWSRKGDIISFSNSGNIHVQLSDGTACKENNQECQDLGAKRVYGGATWELKVPADRIVTFRRRDGVSGVFENLDIPVQTNQ